MFYFISLFIVNQIDVVYRVPAGPGGERRIYIWKIPAGFTTGKEMKQTIEENPIWIPLQTTYCKELQVAEFLRDSEIPYYIPQTYELQDAKDGSERCERILVPAIHNLLFIRCSHSFSHVFHEARTGKCRLLYHFQPGDAEFHAGHQP